MPSRKPTLVLSTPVTASFPAEALMSAASVRTPHSAISTSWRESAGLPSAGLPSAGLPSAGLPSAGLPSAGLHSAGLLSAGLYSPMVAIKTEDGLMKTPMSPPVAYMDFLKLASPIASPCTSSPVTTTSAAAAAANASSNNSNNSQSTSTNARPRILHRASISGPVKISPSNLGSTKNAAAAKSAAAAAAAAAASASSTSLASTASASNSDTESSGNDTEDKDALDSGPSTASSNTTDGCTCEHDHDRERAHKSPKIARIDTAIPASAFAASNIPTSAPPIGRTTFPSLKIPISPAVSNTNNSPIRSPFSAKSTSITSPFDWESALKARYAEFKSPPAKSHAHALSQSQSKPAAAAPATSCAKCSNKTVTVAAAPSSTTTTTSIAASATNAAKTSIRHIREVVTRTVTYTPRVDPPRMNAPPKGKKRKIDCDEAAC